MDKKYLITVRGTQSVDGEQETEELTTTAEYTTRGGKRLLKYREYGSLDGKGEIIVTNVLKIDGDCVTLTKRLDGRTGQMVFECGKRHQCMYANEVGNLTIGIYTESIVDTITEDGGTLEIEYTIDFNGGFESVNYILITLKTEE